MSTPQFWLSEEFDATLTYLNAVSERLGAAERRLVEGPLKELLRIRKDAVREPQLNIARLVSTRLQ
jgi:hypothetical protein